MDVDKFLQEVYDLCASGPRTKALDLVYDTMCMRPLEEMPYELMNEIQGKVDVTKLEYSVIIAFLMQTFKYDSVVPNHIVLYKKAESYFRDKGETEEKIKGLICGFEGAGNYWDAMKAYGAPVWLKGHEPNK